MLNRQQPVLPSLLIVIVLALAGCGEVETTDPEQEAAALDRSDQPVLRQAPPRQRDLPPAGSVQERVEDAVLETRVTLALADDEQLRNNQFDVDVRRGRVFLSGDVLSSTQLEHAQDVAAAVDGVVAVVDDLSLSDDLSDSTLADADPVDTLPDIEPDGQDENAVAPADAEEPAPAETYHTVRSGESLWTIARQYGTSVEAVRRLNNLSSNTLRPGQRIRVK